MILCQNNTQRLPGMQLLAVNCFKITIITVNNNKFISLYEFVIVIVSLLGFVSVGVDCMSHHKSLFDTVFCVFVQCVYIFVLVFFSGYTASVLYYCEHGELEPRVGPGHPSSPLSIYFLIFPPLLFSFFHWLYLFSPFVHPFPFYQNSPTPFLGRRS